MGLLEPRDEADLADAIADAQSSLAVQGGGTRGFSPKADEVLSTAALTGVTLYEPGALTLVAKAGTPVAEIEDLLAKDGQRLAFEPIDHRPLLGTKGIPTIGGVAAANVSGPRRVQLGACRDYMLGVRFVDGRGSVVKNGGRVMKNVTGYDLVKLMAGSYGTLGVLTEISFKVLAKPEAEATLVHLGMDATQSIAALSDALGSPFDISGAAYVAGEKRTQVRIEGLSGSVLYRQTQLQNKVLNGFDIVEGEQSAALWSEVRDVKPFASRTGAVWRVSVKPTDGPILSDQLEAQGLSHDAIFDWGGGLVWILASEKNDASGSVIRRNVAALGGHATLVRGSKRLREMAPVFQPETPALAAISTGLRAKFDPRNILNPGLMG